MPPILAAGGSSDKRRARLASPLIAHVQDSITDASKASMIAKFDAF